MKLAQAPTWPLVVTAGASHAIRNEHFAAGG